ncbi:ABC transporter substrate-binding protein [Natrinema soli]|uniref:ABC transporter substrate-binding protein n=1 Tax=Natrinema soli TaxID=1930624 RepID=A0ABD5STS5_9EURY|nr:ABC transporter substrate-binding protein [Natrinema soli]
MPGVSNSRRSFMKASVAATAGLTALAGCAGGSDEGTIRLAYTVPIENLVSLMDVPEIQDEMENLGDSYEIEISQNSSTPDTLNQMASGDVDLGLLSTVSFGNAVQQEAVPGNISLIATDFWDAHPDNYGFTIYSPSDSDITEMTDIEGATIATNARGTGTHAIYEKAFQDLGLEDGEDVELVELAFPNMTPSINDGSIDAGMYPALFAPQARNEGFNAVFSSQDVWDNEYPFAYLTASNDAMENKDDAINAWGEDYVNLVDYLNENRSDVITAAAEHFDLDEGLLDAFFLTENDYYRDEPVTDIDRMQTMMDDLADLGFLDESFTVDEYINNEYVEQ